MTRTTAANSPAMATAISLPTFLLSAVVLLYLSTFVVFAVIRILFGLSIQRVGYLSLKRISYELEDGIRLEVRKLGLTLHRPTFAQPTWVSLVVQDSLITLDSRPKSVDADDADDVKRPRKSTATASEKSGKKETDDSIRADAEEKTTNMLDGLRKAKESLKKLHKWIQWIQMVDVVFVNTTVAFPGVGSLQIGSVSMMVDTRRKRAERNSVFDHCVDLKDKQQPVEWLLAVRSILFYDGDSKDPLEVMDHSTFTIYGVLDEAIDGIRDLAFALKIGRMSLPLDELISCSKKLKGAREARKQKFAKHRVSRGSLSVMMEEMALPGSRTERMAQAVLESKELLESFLKGIKEIQFAVGHLIVSKSVPRPQAGEKPLHFTLAMKELGMDVHRLDQNSPAHRMYFSPNDIAHQALLAAISISLSVRDGDKQPDLVMYVPMVTMTSRTTLLSKTIQIIEKSESNRNANILFSNMVVTSPAIDLKPEHIPIFMTMLSSGRRTRSPGQSAERAHLMSRLLPKATIKFSIQEPVIRIVLPPTEPEHQGPHDMDMLISSLSSISIDLDSSHEAEGQITYMLTSSLRINSHVLYYRASSGVQYDLLHTETFDLKAQLTATPEVQVVVNAYLSSFSLRLVRPELVNALKQMVEQFRTHYRPGPPRPLDPTASQNFIRTIPVWLDQFKIECNDFVIEVAGIDKKISENTRGAAFQMDSFTIDYKCRKAEQSHRITPRRRTGSRTLSVDDARVRNSAAASRKASSKSKNPTDGRKLSFHARGFEGFVVEPTEAWEQDPFLAIPMLDLSFITSSDLDGPILNFAAPIKSIFLNYSLYRHYSVIVASTVLLEVMGKKPPSANKPKEAPRSIVRPAKLGHSAWGSMDMVESPVAMPEFISYDIKVQHVKFKAVFPDDPPMMLQMHGVDAGRHRWGFPFLKSKHFRLYTESPNLKKCWARLISLKHFRVDFRDMRRRSKDQITTSEKSIDLTADAIRIGVPNQLILYKVTDNIINTVKACEQMHHRFKTGSSEYILEKKPEEPKKVPKVTLRSKALLFELEDDPFESKLGMIYRIGLLEQRKRLAREEAFELKARMLDDSYRRKSWGHDRMADNLRSRGRARTVRGEPSSGLRSDDLKRSKSTGRSVHNMRFDPDEAPEPMSSAAVSISEAWAKLQKLNSDAWIKRITQAKEEERTKIANAREAFWGPDDMPSDLGEGETVLGLPLRPSLMSCFFNDVSITLDKPSFPMEELPDFLHRVGKGLPKDTLFSLLVPVSIKIDFSEAKILLRDYPLPFIHVPPLRPGQPSRLPAWSLKSDFVIAEEFRPGPESIRHANVVIVHPGENGQDGFNVDVRRTVSPVKMYSDIKVAINTSYATRITWCTSYQPAIQDMMMVFETFTKPHVDPSERPGFWDKIRLVLHSQLTLAWEGDGDVHLTLKGSRDPYEITGEGAGFVMSWSGDVRWDMARSEDPRKLLEVTSEKYFLAVPDFTNQASQPIDAFVPETKSFLSGNSDRNAAPFKKVIMKLSGGVSWQLGLMFEQEISDHEDWKQRERSFEFKPHYEVTLKSPEYAKAPPGEVYDAFRGFRSHHLHMSLAIIAPINKDANGNADVANSYNTIHLTPRFFTHFFSWWNLFSGPMSLPIRQGDLWPGPEKSSKKFGRHLATIKYKLCLAPLFVSHIYKHHDKDEDGNDIVAATGLKAKLDDFLLDIHQRREENVGNPKSTGMKMNQAELDFHSADIRAVSAVVDNVTVEDMLSGALPDDASEQIAMENEMLSGNNSDRWIDHDDFVELDWACAPTKTPRAKVMPLACTPRFTYFRQTDHSSSLNSVCSLSPFGNEPSHECMLSQNNDPREIQCGLVQARLERVNEQMSRNKMLIDNLARDIKENPDDLALRAKSDKLIQQSEILFNKLQFLQAMLRRISSKLDDGDVEDSRVPSGYQSSRSSSEEGPEMPELDNEAFGDYISDFDNRFIVHNMQAKWNNSLRNIILKYIHQVGQRRGFVYYMSRRAVKFILDILEEQRASGQFTKSATTEFSESPAGTTDLKSDDASIEDRIQRLLSDNVKVAVAEEREPGTKSYDATATMLARDNLAGDVADEYVPQNSYHVRLIAPQIQLQSEKNEGAAVLVAAQGMQLKIVSIMDRERVGDDVSGLVQRRFALNLDNTQFFVSHHQDFAPSSMSLHSANSYGAPNGKSWPPWVPLESMFDFRNNPVGFSRVVERTSATLRYDKHNSLRLKYSDQVSGVEAEMAATKNGPISTERRIDYVWVDFPRVEATCDSSQYFAMYIIVLDLLLYAEPSEKIRNEKLEKIMLASDFSDLTGTPEMVERLQSRIRTLYELKENFQIHAKQLDAEGWKSRASVDRALASCEDELFFMMKAITTAQRKKDDRSSKSSGVVRWYLTASNIVWHLLREKADPLMDIALQKAAYERVDNADGSNYNTVEVEMLRGYNLLEDAAYPEMIAPFWEHSKAGGQQVPQTKMLRVYWNMLEAIGGIPILDHFEVNLYPMKIQLERDIGEKIFEYIFPGVGKSAFESGGFSPFIVHSMKPVPDDAQSEHESDSESQSVSRTLTTHMDDSSSARSDLSGHDNHLHPTLSHSPDRRPKTSGSIASQRPKTSGGISISSRTRGLRRGSVESYSLQGHRKSIDGGATPSIYVSEKQGRKLQLFSRSSTSNVKAPSDELSQMMNRASNYMTLSYIKIPSVVLCLSYKGRGESNIEDVHEFVFKMPMLEYRNKTWSNLDLAIHLKRDIIRALISHTGAILQNKLTHHRPTKPQPNQLRMMANNGALSSDSSRDTLYERPGSSSGLSRMTSLDPRNSNFLRADSTLSSASAFSPESSSASSSMAPSGSNTPGYAPSVQSGESSQSSGLFANTRARLASRLKEASTANGDDDESIKKKSKLLLGKKVFGGL